MGAKTKLDIDLDAERWKADRKCLLDKKQGPLMDERHIGCQDRENVGGNPIRLGFEMISQFSVADSFCGIWLNEPHFTPRCLVHFQIAPSFTSQSISPNYQIRDRGVSLPSPDQFSAQF